MKVRKKMKHHLSVCLGLLALCLLSGCYITPNALNPYTQTVPMQIPRFGNKILLFEEIRHKVLVKVITSGDNPEIADIVKQRLEQSDFAAVTNGSFRDQTGKMLYDLQLNFTSAYEQIKPAPNCIMHNDLNVTISSIKGNTNYSDPWSHRSETNEPSPTESAAKARLLPDIKRAVGNWVNNSFIAEGNKYLDVAILRFRTENPFIEFDPYNYEHAVLYLRNLFSRIDGIVAFDVVESKKWFSRIVSFRVLYRKNQFPNGLSEAVKNASDKIYK